MNTKKRRANGATDGKGNRRRRKNGTGTLERRGDRWLARWYVYDAHGKRVRQSQTIEADTLDQARAELRRLTEGDSLITREKVLRDTRDKLEGVKAELRNWEDKQPALALADTFDAYENSTTRPDSGARTLADYRGYFSGFLSWVAINRPTYEELRDVTQEDAQAYANDLKDRVSAGTYNKRVVFFRCLWRVLADHPKARLGGNPWEKIQKREVVEHTRRELTTEELAKVCGSVTGEMRTLFAVGIYTGLRLGDCALLDWGSVDLVRRRISLIPRKTKRHSHGKPVVIPIHPTLAAILMEGETERSGYVMPEIAATYEREPSLLTSRIQKTFRDCGIKTTTKQGEGRKAAVDVGFHSLRHTFVSLSANAGAPLAVVQSIVGHSNPAMTRHYFHEQESALISAVAALPDVTGETIQQEDGDAGEGRLRAFCAAWDALATDEDRRRALRYAKAHSKGVSK